MNEGWLRVRGVLDRRFALVVAVLLVVAAAGAWVTYGAHVAPETTTTERTVETGRVTGTFVHGAEVTEGARAAGFDPGSRVENRSVYFDAVMPVLDGAFALSYEDRAPAQVRVERTVEVRSATTDLDDETVVYWNRTLSRTSQTAALRPGDRLRVPFDIDAAERTSDAENVSDRLRSPGQVRLRVDVDVTVTRGVDGATPRDLSANLTVVPEGGVYRVESTGGVETFERTETVTRRVRPGPLRSLGGPVLALVSLADAAGLVVARRRGLLELSERERAWLSYRDDREDFDEWITTVRLPADARGLPTAEAASLADLVDFAIDTDNAVMETPGERTFHVVHDGYRYTFTAPSVPASVTADGLGSSGTRSEEGSDPGRTVDPEAED
jgi:hypothetical protein